MILYEHTIFVMKVASGRQVAHEKHYNKGQRLQNLSVSEMRTRLGLLTTCQGQTRVVATKQ